MAKLSLSCPCQTTAASTGGTTGVSRRVLLRMGGPVPANTAIDVNNPGTGWVMEGTDVVFSGTEDFVQSSQIYRNGELQLAGEGASDDYDVYFVAASGTLAFESIIHKHDVVQIWDYTTATSGTP
jgi:hypothetical protein